MGKIKRDYKNVVEEAMPKSEHLKNAVFAFLIGGAICTLGHGINLLSTDMLSLGEQEAAAVTAMTLVFLGAFLTGLGVYDKIGKIAGAGTVVPITGFANSVVAPAMEFRREGLIMGTAAKMFTIAGPVLVYGIGVSVIIGLLSLFFG